MKLIYDEATATIFDKDADVLADDVIGRDVNPAYAALLVEAPEMRELLGLLLLELPAALRNSRMPHDANCDCPLCRTHRILARTAPSAGQPPAPPVGGDVHG